MAHNPIPSTQSSSALGSAAFRGYYLAKAGRSFVIRDRERSSGRRLAPPLRLTAPVLACSVEVPSRCAVQSEQRQVSHRPGRWATTSSDTRPSWSCRSCTALASRPLVQPVTQGKASGDRRRTHLRGVQLWWSPRVASRLLGCRPSPGKSTPTSGSFTPTTTAVPRSWPTGACSWSARATPVPTSPWSVQQLGTRRGSADRIAGSFPSHSKVVVTRVPASAAVVRGHARADSAHAYRTEDAGRGAQHRRTPAALSTTETSRTRA